MNAILVVFYVIFAVGGSTLIKYGGIAKGVSWLVPIANISVSPISLLGIISYGLSFALYILLLNKFDLSFISPLTVGLVYVLLMATAVIVFNEQFTLVKTIGCILILVGILLILINK